MPQDKRDTIYTAYDGHIAQLQGELEARARTEAAQHQPPTGRTNFDSNEAEALAEADRCSAGEQRLFEGKLLDPARQLSDARSRLEALKQVPDPQSVITQLDSELQQVLAKGRSVQEELAENRMRREVDLRHFRDVNRITSPATYPLSRWNHVSLVALSIFIESIANTAFYQNENGLLGGFVVALGVSFLNIGFAFALGMGFRYKNLSDRFYRSLGWLCVIGFILLTMYFNALFASFRSEYQAIADPSNLEALRLAFARAMNQAGRIFTLHTTLSDFMSFVLFGVGILLSGFAFYKGYHLDDQYPGHGDKDRRYRGELEAEREHTEMLRGQLASAIARERADAVRTSQEPRELLGLCARRRGDIVMACKGAEHQFKAIQRDFQQIITAYRNANRAIRQNEPPAYWNSLPELSVGFDDSSATALLSDLDSVQHELSALVASAAAQSNRWVSALGEYAKEFMEKRFPLWLTACEDEAKERLNRSTPGVHTMGALK